MIAVWRLLPIEAALKPQIEAIALAAVAEGRSARMALVFCAKTRGAGLVRQRVKQGAVALIVAVGLSACQGLQPPISGMQPTQSPISVQDLDRQIDQAISTIRQNPNSQDAYLNFGDMLDRRGKLQAVIDRYMPLVEASPNDATLRVILGILWQNNGQPDRAIEQHQKALALQPDYAFAYSNWGVALVDKGDWDGAIAKYQRAIELKPDFAAAYSNWGVALVDKGDWDGAIAKYQRAIKLKPDFATAYQNWGVVLAKKGDKDGAITKYQRAIELKPDYVLAYHDWGNALSDKGDQDGASAKYKRAIQLQPDYARFLAQRLLSKFHIIAPKEAIAEIDDSQQLPKDEPRLPLLRATVLAIAQFSQPEDTERGAAWVVKRQGSTLWLVTCAHLFRNERNEQSQAIQVQFYNPNPNLPAEKRASRAATVVQLAPSGGLDLAVLKVENAPADIRPLAMGPGSIPLLAPVYTIGHPNILAQAGPWQALSGEVAGRDGNRVGLNITISQGNSGGPLLHKETNQVIGIVFQRQGDRVGYAYDIQTVQTQLKQWGIL